MMLILRAQLNGGYPGATFLYRSTLSNESGLSVTQTGMVAFIRTVLQ